MSNRDTGQVQRGNTPQTSIIEVYFPMLQEDDSGVIQTTNGLEMDIVKR